MTYRHVKRYKIPAKIRNRVFKEKGHHCAYCGSYANQIDHATPHWWTQNDDFDNLVPACRECNNIAGRQIFETLEEKRDYIITQKTIKAGKVVIWMKDDYDELSYSLRTSLKNIIVVETDSEYRHLIYHLTQLGVEHIR